MKIKQRLEDFIVEEVLKAEKGKEGRCSLYILKKRKISTLSCLKIISDKLKIPLADFGYCGLKDKQGITIQHISLPEVKKAALKEKNFSFEYFRKISSPLQRGGCLGNNFIIRVYDIDREKLIKNIEEVNKRGFVNYYDIQRTGHLLPEKSFGCYALKKDYKNAVLRYYIHHSRFAGGSRKKEFKKLFNNWPQTPEKLDLPWNIIGPLKRLREKPGDYKGAILQIPKPEKELLISGFQAMIWNRIVKKYIEKTKNAHKLDSYIPLPTERGYSDKGIEKIYRQVIRGFDKEDFKNAQEIGVKLNYGKRKIIVVPKNLRIKFEGSSAVLSFFLPSGSYATMLIKTIAGGVRIK
jgi:tRNA pseudouridine13 synthase